MNTVSIVIFIFALAVPLGCTQHSEEKTEKKVELQKEIPVEPTVDTSKSKELSVSSESADSLVAANTIPVAKGDYPWWRGTDCNDIFPEDVKAPLHWNEKENIRWQTPIPGNGYGTPILIGDKIYLVTSEFEDQSDLMTVSIIALERKTGKIITKKVLKSGKRQKRLHADNSNAPSTPACDGKRIFYPYVIDNHIYLDCVDMNLNPLWSVDLGMVKAYHGYAGSPVLYDDKVILCTDMVENKSGLCAYYRETGKLCWRTERHIAREPSYITPTLIRSSNRDQLVLNGPDTSCSYDPKTGELLWEATGPSNCCPSSPGWDEKRVYFSGGWPKKVLIAVNSDGSAKEPVWQKTRPVAPYVPSLICKDGRLYCVSDESGMFCLNAEDGETLWLDKIKEKFYSSPVIVGDRIYIFGRSGGAWIYQTGPTLKKLAENHLDCGVWANPVFADGGIYLRTLKYICFISEDK